MTYKTSKYQVVKAEHETKYRSMLVENNGFQEQERTTIPLRPQEAPKKVCLMALLILVLLPFGASSSASSGERTDQSTSDRADESKKSYATVGIGLGFTNCMENGDASCDEHKAGPNLSLDLQSRFNPTGDTTQLGLGINFASGATRFENESGSHLLNLLGFYGLAHVYIKLSQAMLLDVSIGPGYSYYSSIPLDNLEEEEIENASVLTSESWGMKTGVAALFGVSQTASLGISVEHLWHSPGEATVDDVKVSELDMPGQLRAGLVWKNTFHWIETPSNSSSSSSRQSTVTPQDRRRQKRAGYCYDLCEDKKGFPDAYSLCFNSCIQRNAR